MIVPVLTPLAQDRGQNSENQHDGPQNGRPPREDRQTGPQSHGGLDRQRSGGSRQNFPRNSGAPQPGQSIFSLLDSNRDGVLDKREIKSATSVLQRLDTNHDGVVERREIGFIAPMGDPQRNQGPGARRNPPERQRGSLGDNYGPRSEEERQDLGRQDRQRNQDRNQDQNRNQNQGRTERQNQGDNGSGNQAPRTGPQRDGDRQEFRNPGPNENPRGQGEAPGLDQRGREDRPGNRRAQQERDQGISPRGDADFRPRSNRSEQPNPAREESQRRNLNPQRSPNPEFNQEQGQNQNQQQNERRSLGDKGRRDEAPPADPQKDPDRKPE